MPISSCQSRIKRRFGTCSQAVRRQSKNEPTRVRSARWRRWETDNSLLGGSLETSKEERTTRSSWKGKKPRERRSQLMLVMFYDDGWLLTDRVAPLGLCCSIVQPCVPVAGPRFVQVDWLLLSAFLFKWRVQRIDLGVVEADTHCPLIIAENNQ